MTKPILKKKRVSVKIKEKPLRDPKTNKFKAKGGTQQTLDAFELYYSLDDERTYSIEHILKGGTGSGSWSGPGQPRFAFQHHVRELTQSQIASLAKRSHVTPPKDGNDVERFLNDVKNTPLMKAVNSKLNELKAQTKSKDLTAWLRITAKKLQRRSTRSERF